MKKNSLYKNRTNNATMSKNRKIFVTTVFAIRGLNGQGQFRYFVTLRKAFSRKTAEAEARADSLQQLPKGDGWTQHKTGSFEISKSEIRKLLKN